MMQGFSRPGGLGEPLPEPSREEGVTFTQKNIIVQSLSLMYLTAKIFYRNLKHIFSEKELRANSDIHVSVFDIYISTIGLHILL